MKMSQIALNTILFSSNDELDMTKECDRIYREKMICSEK